MTSRLLSAAVALLVIGCSTAPAPRVNELLRDKQLAQDNAYAEYNDLSWKGAARNFQRTADILNSLDDYAGEAAARHNQGRALQHAGQFEAAIAAYQRSLDINRRMNRASEQSYNLVGLAQCHAALGRLPQAIQAAEQALPIATTAKLIVQNDLASLLIQRNQPGDLDRARKLLDAALVADPKLAVTQLNLGRAALAAGQHAEARAKLTGALEAFRANQNPAGIACTHETLARCCQALGDKEAARFHRDEARQKFTFLKDAAALQRLDSTQP